MLHSAQLAWRPISQCSGHCCSMLFAFSGNFLKLMHHSIAQVMRSLRGDKPPRLPSAESGRSGETRRAIAKTGQSRLAVGLAIGRCAGLAVAKDFDLITKNYSKFEV